MRKSANTRPRRVLGAILALCMLVGLLPMTAFAAAPQVPYADWDGTTARWAKPEGYQRIRYHISLVKTDDVVQVGNYCIPDAIRASLK